MANSDYYIQDNSDIEETKLAAAKEHYNAGNYSRALMLYMDMVSMSYSYKLHYEIGRCYYKLEKYNDAEIYFKQSISLEQDKNPSYLYLGNLFFKRQEVELAIENWIIAYSQKPDDEAVCLNLATTYFSKNMRFQSLYFYEKYLRYAKDKTTEFYKDVKKSINEFSKSALEFYQKAQKAILMDDKETAIQALTFSANNYPINFDVNYLLGKLFYEKEDYMQALIYLKQAYCLDSKSLDVLEKLPYAMINLGDYTSAYCCLKRLLPLIINNQKEYLETMKLVTQIENGIDSRSTLGHRLWAERYYKDNNYHLALFEYENCLIIDGSKTVDVAPIVKKIKSFIDPEERIIKSCFEKGEIYYSNRDYKQSNRYFNKVMSLTSENSSEYKYAKSRLVNA